MRFSSMFLVAASALAIVTGTAQAADLQIPAAPVVPTPTSSWDGPYIGVFAGYTAGTITATDPFLSPETNSVYYNGWQLGVQGGYNFHITGDIVGGFGADIAWSNASGSDSNSYATSLDWTGSVTGKLGVDVGNLVPYLVGGVAITNASLTDGAVPPVTDSQTHVGYTAGAGLEYAISDNISADVEYRYTDYGTSSNTYALANQTYNVNLHDNAIRIGLNFHP